MNENNINIIQSEPTKEQENTGGDIDNGDIGQINFLPSYSKGYRSFLDGFNRNITGNIQYSDYNNEFIYEYFPQDIIDSLRLKEGKYDIIGIFNGECLVYNKSDKKVESHNCEMTEDKKKSLAAAKIQNLYRRKMARQQLLEQETMNQNDKPVKLPIEDNSVEPRIDAGPSTDVVNERLLENGPAVEMLEAAPEQLMIQAATPKPPMPILPVQNQFQFNVPTEPISLPKIVEKTQLLIKDSPSASQQQEFTSQNDTGPQESRQQSTDTDSEKVDVMKKYTIGNIKSNINNDIISKLGKNDIKTPGCRANQFITSNLCEYDDDNTSKVGKKNGLLFHPDRNKKCPEYGKHRIEMLHNFCNNKEIPDEYKNTEDYKEKYNAAKEEVEKAEKEKAPANGLNTVFNISTGKLSNNVINKVTKPSTIQEILPTTPSIPQQQVLRLLQAPPEEAAKQKEAQEQAARKAKEAARKAKEAAEEKQKAAAAKQKEEKEEKEAAQARLAAQAKEAAQEAAKAARKAEEEAKQKAAQARLAAEAEEEEKAAKQKEAAKLAKQKAAEAKQKAKIERKAAEKAAKLAKQQNEREAKIKDRKEKQNNNGDDDMFETLREFTPFEIPEPEEESQVDQDGHQTQTKQNTSRRKKIPTSKGNNFFPHTQKWNNTINPEIRLGGKKAKKSKKNQQNKQGRKTRKKRS